MLFIMTSYLLLGEAWTKSMETLNLERVTFEMVEMCGRTALSSVSDHQTVVHQQRIFHIGGFDYTKGMQDLT